MSFPSEEDVDLDRPDAEETAFISRGLLSAMAPPTGATALQRTLVEATAESMTGHVIDTNPASTYVYQSGAQIGAYTLRPWEAAA